MGAGGGGGGQWWMCGITCVGAVRKAQPAHEVLEDDVGRGRGRGGGGGG